MASCQRARERGGLIDGGRDPDRRPICVTTPDPKPVIQIMPNHTCDALHVAARPQSLGAEDPDPSGGPLVGWASASWSPDGPWMSSDRRLADIRSPMPAPAPWLQPQGRSSFLEEN